MKLFENFNTPIRLRENDERSINKGQSIYDEMSHNVAFFFQYTTK